MLQARGNLSSGVLSIQTLRRRLLPPLLGLAAMALSSVAFGSDPTPEDRTTARALAYEGHEALKTKNYATAADRFKRADQLVHAPTLLVDLGRSYIGLGRLVEGHEAFQQVLREGVAPDAPATWRRALIAAQEEDAKLTPRLAWVTIRVEGANEPRVTLGDEPLSAASLGVRRAIDPGPHSVVAEAPGFLPARNDFNLAEGEAGELRLVLKRDPSDKPATTVAPAKKPVFVVEQRAARPHTSAFAAYGVSAAGLLLSGVSGILMLRARGELEAECHDGHCPRTAANADDLSRYHTFGTLAAVGLGVGLAGAGVGTYILVSDKPNQDRGPRRSLTAQLSPGYVGVSGRF
jgi:hypothetical protein